MEEKDADACMDCEKSFTQQGNSLAIHKIHTVENSFSCTQCAKSFNRKAYLTNHQRIHKGQQRPFFCTMCEKSFPRKEQFVLHQKIHTEYTSFSCATCEKSFSVKEHLLKHQIIHTQKTSLSCTECGKSFFLKEHLQRHQQIHNAERPFSCSQCEKSFKRKEHLQRHQNVHSGERPFLCSQCEKRFSQKGHLQKHQRIHSGERPFSCSQCEKSFSQKGHLQKHQIIHTERCMKTLTQRPYSCTECDKSFSRHENLITHQKIHTSYREFGDNNPESERSFTGSLLWKTTSAAQEENDQEKEEDLEDVKKEREINCNKMKKGHSMWGSIYSEMQAESNLNKHTEKEILEAPTVRSRTVVIKAATFTFNSSVTIAPLTSPLPTLQVNETTYTPIPDPAFSSVSPPSVPAVLPQPGFDTEVGMLKTFHIGSRKGEKFTFSPNEKFPM